MIDTDHFKWVNDLSMFYGRYDVQLPIEIMLKELVFVIPVGSPICLTDKQIRMCLGHIRSSKALGPDGLGGYILKVCANELPHPLTFCKLYII